MSIFRNSSFPMAFLPLVVVVALAAPAADCTVFVTLMIQLLPVSCPVRQKR